MRARRSRVGTAVVVILGFAVVILVASCSDSITGPAEPITALPRALSTAEVALIGAGNTFAVELLREVHRAVPDSTIFLSPLSASIALGMTLNGAAGNTRDQMHRMLGFGSLSMSQVNASYRDLITLLRDLDPRVDLGLANAIFHRESFQMEAPFLETVRAGFDARVEGLDFNDPGAVNVINAWVRDATENRIQDIVESPIDPLTMAFLMNAIYFKGDWTKEFDAEDTYTGPFHLLDGASEDVRFMRKADTLAYRASEAWQAVEIPYGGGAWAMAVAIPRDGYTLQAVLEDLATLLDPEAEWDERVLEIHLPRFELEWERVLNDDLRALGMVDAFVPDLADFTPMYRRAREVGLHVEEVKQKTFLKVDERGTEAAAVTVVEVMVESLGGGPQRLKADRPFLLAIRERLSGTVLFAGLIIEAPG